MENECFGIVKINYGPGRDLSLNFTIRGDIDCFRGIVEHVILSSYDQIKVF